jgi:hypothetical protein
MYGVFGTAVIPFGCAIVPRAAISLTIGLPHSSNERRWTAYDPGMGPKGFWKEKLPVRTKNTSGVEDSAIPQAPVVFWKTCKSLGVEFGLCATS